MNGTKPEDAAERIVVAAGKFAEAMRLEGRSPDVIMHAARFLGRDQCWTDYENWTPSAVSIRSRENGLENQRADGHDVSIYERRVRGPKEPAGVTAPKEETVAVGGGK
jgi:hypothetical protein